MPHRDPERLSQIERTAAELFGRFGYYATSLQSLADAVGLTKAGLLHYVGSKDNLLTLVMRDVYDADAMAKLGADGNDQPVGTVSLPGYLRDIVAQNAERPHLVRLFTMLNTETLNPDHPARQYFQDRERLLEHLADNPCWRVPEGVDVHATLNAAMLAMDGIQIKWLREPDRDLVAMWKQIEPALFPETIWGPID